MSLERARLFVALELPPDVRRALSEWGAGALPGADEGIRLVPSEDLHVTLCFLGWREAGALVPIARACRVVRGRGAIPLRLGEPVVLPRRRPRVLAVGLEDPNGRLAQVQAALSAALRDGGFYEPDDREFFGHVTVARSRRGARIPRSASLAPAPELELTASCVVLFRSRLGRGGASYEPLEEVDLESA